MSDELMPCPFCGGKPYLANVEMVGCSYVVCTDCRTQSNDMAKERAITAWNTRTDAIPNVAYVAGLEAALRDISSALDDQPEYHTQGMGCGLEDRNITDRYDAMAYGWESAMERVYDEHIEFAKDTARPASPDVRVVTVEQLELWAKMLEKPLYFREYAAEIRAIIAGQT